MRHDRLQKLARRVVSYARQQLGVAYSWGGTSPRTGFDCSGLVFAAYRSIG
jgi:cell wall-associated NlpC family hydrolase